MNIKERELEMQTVDPMDDPERKLSVVKQMEQEWPEMTSEFKKLQREQYILFCNNNMIMVLVIYLWEHNYRHQKKLNYH